MKKGVIWIDLNGTLVDEHSGHPTTTESILKNAVAKAQNCGWDVGLCSDSPMQPLLDWGIKKGFNRKVIAENGSLIGFSDGKKISVQVLGKRINITRIKSIVMGWTVENGISILPDMLSNEFCSRKHSEKTGIAFGALRMTSVSIFVFKKGLPNSYLTRQLVSYLKKDCRIKYIEVGERYGFIGIYASDPRYMKGNALRLIGYELFRQNKQCWVIGNSENDLSYFPVFCPVGFVRDERNTLLGELNAENSCTNGVIELMDIIVQTS